MPAPDSIGLPAWAARGAETYLTQWGQQRSPSWPAGRTDGRGVGQSDQTAFASGLGVRRWDAGRISVPGSVGGDGHDLSRERKNDTRTNTMTRDLITHADLEWWIELAAELEWTFAKTYAQTAPHHYVVENRTPGVTHEDMVRAARVIHTFGQPGKYYSLTKIYLVSPDGKHRWWTEDKHFTDTTLVNRATTEFLYGVQNQQPTVSGIETPFDGIATTWDAEHPTSAGDPARVKQLLAGVRGTYPPHALDIGCGTGRVLDLELVAPDRYAGVDPSQAMLNLLLRKHPRAAAVYPLDIRSALRAHSFTPRQFDWVFVDSSVELTAAERTQVEDIARLAVIEVEADDWSVRDVTEQSVQRVLARSAASWC